MYIKTGSGSGASSTNWKNATQLYIKTAASVWSRVKQGYIKTGSGSGTSSTNWKRFFFEANLPTITTKPSIRSANTSGTGTIYDGEAATSPQFLNVDLFGKDGAYSNYTSIPDASRRFSYADNLDDTTRSTLINDDRFSSAGGITTANRTTLDGKYLFYEVQVNNGTGDDYINPVSNGIKMIKRQPELDTSFTTALTGQASPSSTLTFTYYLKNNYYDKVIPSTSKIKWWRSTDNTASGTLVKEEILTDTITSSGSVLQGVSTYSIATSADNDYYIVVEIVGVSSWTEHNSYPNGYQIAKRFTALVQGEYRFVFGNTLYVSSNGHIGLDTSTNASSFNTHSSGRSISIYLKDLTQYYLAEYSDNDVYYLYSKGYLQGTSAAASNAVDYQVKFYKDPAINYCDVKMIRYGSNVTIPTATQGFYTSGLSGHAGVVGPYFIGAGSVFRVYFKNKPAEVGGFTWTDINDTYWDVIQTWTSPGVDDTYTAVVTAANQSAPIPINTVAPTLSTNTGNFSAGSVITVNTGTWTGTNSYTYNLLYDSSTPVPTNAGARTLNASNEYTITLGDATNISYYFRAKVTGYSGSGQTGNSAIAYGVTSSRSYIDPTTTISVGTATATGFTVSGTAGPLNGIGTAYVSVSKIEIFNSAYTSVASITTGLPSVDGTTGAWSYIWTGGSAATTYYAKVTVKSTDTAVTTYTTAFSTSIATSAATTAPTSFTSSTTYSDKITLDWSGGSGTSYEFYWGSSNTAVPGANSASFTTTNTATYDWNAVRGSTYYLYIRAATGATKSSWFPTSAPGRTGYMKLYAPPAPTITNKATTSTSLSWYWDSPTPSTTEDYPSSWDYAQTTGSTSPTSGWTNLTTRPTTTSPLVISSLSSSTDYYLHVKAKNADASVLATPVKATTDAPAVTSPGTPSSATWNTHTYAYVTNSLSTTLSPSASGNASKTQNWTYQARVTFNWSWGTGTNASSYEVYFSSSSADPISSTTGTNVGTATSHSFTGVQTGRGTLNRYAWVRSVNSAGNSAWRAAGLTTSTATVVSGLNTAGNLKICRTGTSTCSNAPTTGMNTVLTHTYLSVNTGFSHVAYISGMNIADGTGLSANS